MFLRTYFLSMLGWLWLGYNVSDWFHLVLAVQKRGQTPLKLTKGMIIEHYLLIET